MTETKPASPLEATPDLCQVVTTAPPDHAERLAEVLVSERLAACVQLLVGVRSVYRWEGGVRNDPETVLLLKTTEERLEALARALRRLHPYEVPEILVFRPGHGDAGYAAWLREACRPTPEDGGGA